MNICTNCDSKDDYNYSLNIGLCNRCIGEKLEGLEETVRWMLKDIDYRNEGTGIGNSDSPEVVRARELIEG